MSEEDEFLIELRKIVSEASNYLSGFEEARERVLRLTREVVKLSSRAIVEVERGKEEKAKRFIEQGVEILVQLEEIAGKFVDLRRYLHDAERELFEAILTFEFVTGCKPRVSDVEISHSAKVAALFDFAGELKRLFYSFLLKRDVAAAERALRYVEEIYTSLASSDVTNASVHNFKFKLDALRKQVEALKRDFLFCKMGYGGA